MRMITGHVALPAALALVLSITHPMSREVVQATGQTVAKPGSTSGTKQNQRQVKKPPMISGEVSTLPLSLAELIANSERIFVGTVDRIGAGAHPHYPGRTFVTTILTVKEPYFLIGKKESPTYVSQAVGNASEVEKGDTVLWFVGSIGASGMSSPLGLHSGDFAVDGAPESHFAMARNRHGNVGLWSGPRALWKVASRDKVEDELKDMGAPKEKIAHWLERGDASESKGPLPLDLLIAIVRTATR